ncbi:MAG: prepilin-type N-terminal cleavage/methylation domain-containing protein [Deltaproteobacteria bacterium]|jgi:prepilin-type N-terminal cleavage/methylation domain-containing protein|nr:prepilin-type N-terminal cleavage/methylation domain-containing protein [Deltaproteobacteria bacterium]
MFPVLISRPRFKPGFTLLELLVVVGILGILSVIAISQYSRYRLGAQNASAKEAAHSVAISEEAFFIFHSKYSANYASLVLDGGLIINYNILYGPITVTVLTDPPSYTFTVNHEADDSATYTYRSEGVATIREEGARLTANDPTVPVPNGGP